MNATTYIFGKSDNVWLQSTYDYSSKLFNQGFDNEADSQIRIFRHGDIFYAAYYRKLNVSTRIGFGIVLNGEYIVNITDLFTLFENATQHLIEDGSVLKIDSDGKLDLATTSWSEISESLEDSKKWLEYRLSSENYKLKRLPAINMGANSSDTNTLGIDDLEEDDIIYAIRGNASLNVVKSGDIDTSKLKGYRGQIQSLSQTIDKIEKEKTELEKKNAKLKRANKNFTIVIILGTILFIGGITLFGIHNVLVKTENQLSDTRTVLKNTSDTLNVTKATLSVIEDDLESEKRENSRLNNKIHELEKDLESRKIENSKLSTENTKLKAKITELENQFEYWRSRKKVGYTK